MLSKLFARPISRRPSMAIPVVNSRLEQQYRRYVTQHALLFDEGQLSVLQDLQTLLDHLPAYSSGYVTKAKTSRKNQCLYIFGGVGRGKSMLMSLFYDACPLPQKRRVHFSVFMTEVHAFIHECQQHHEHDALTQLAKKIRSTITVLCFDEFQVTDIADAMILGRLFSKLFELGVVIVMTSNRHPNELHQGGLLREQILFFIKELDSYARIVELSAKQDYRLSYAPAKHPSYYSPLDKRADTFANHHFQRLVGDTAIKPGALDILGHTLVFTALHKNIALASFDELCVRPLGPQDYLALAQRIRVLILVRIPKLSANHRNEAKRFVTLVDVLYEHKIQLICTAEVPAEALYTDGDGAFEFKRAVSRLIEMQSEHYHQSALSSD